MVLFVVPDPNKGSPARVLLTGLVESIWKNQKKPQLTTTPVAFSHVVALRCVQLSLEGLSEKIFTCNCTSTPWVIEPVSVVAVLDVESSRNSVEHLQVQLTRGSLEVMDSLDGANSWWPQDDEGMLNGAQAGLYVSRKRRRNRQPKAKAKAKAAAATGDLPDSDPEEHVKMPTAADASAGKKKRRRKKIEKKVSGKKLSKLKAAKKLKPIAFLAENVKRNGLGPALVHQTMRTLLALEMEKFPDKASFVDGVCVIDLPGVRGVSWDCILASAHQFFIAEQLD